MATAKKKKTGKRSAAPAQAPAPTRTPSFWTELRERGLDVATGIAMGAKLASGGTMHDVFEIGKERLRIRH